MFHHGDTENTEKANEFNLLWSSGSLNLFDGLLNGCDPSFALHGLVLRDLRASVVNLHEGTALNAKQPIKITERTATGKDTSSL